MEDLQHLAQANISMDIDTFTNLNPQVLQVSPGERELRQTGQARGALGHGSTGTQSQRCADSVDLRSLLQAGSARSYPRAHSSGKHYPRPHS